MNISILFLKQILFATVISTSVSYLYASSCAMAMAMVSTEDYENFAKETMPKASWDYLHRGSLHDQTINENIIAFSKIRVLPRLLRNTANRTSEAKIFNGKTFKLPIGIAPTGIHKRWHPEGENATIRAAASIGTIYIVSSATSIPIEELVNVVPKNTELWFQTYLMKSENLTYDFIRQAEDAGFNGLVITIDLPVPALRYHNKKNAYKDQHSQIHWVKYAGNRNERRKDSVTWEDLGKLTKSTKLPVIVKGILTPEDAKLAYHHGAKAIIVSNHGGRELDGAISSIEALERITREFPDATEKGFDIYMDSGIRTGLDVFRAIALGAKFVFAGRAAMWGLFHSGQQGIENVMEILHQELLTTMAQAGCDSLACINRDLVTFSF